MNSTIDSVSEVAAGATISVTYEGIGPDPDTDHICPRYKLSVTAASHTYSDEVLISDETDLPDDLESLLTLWLRELAAAAVAVPWVRAWAATARSVLDHLIAARAGADAR